MNDDSGLLASVVGVARAIFGAKASSILLHDPATRELVFAAVAGEGEDTLLGRRIPEGTGVAGWVLASRQPVVLEDVRNDPRFATDVAEGTAYVPDGLMAAPLMSPDERALGVLSVLDRPANSTFSLAELDLLSMFADQAAVALGVLDRAQRMSGGEGDLAALARLGRQVDRLEGERRVAALALVDNLSDLLEP
jgi:GAF domain-containing protein